MVSPSTTHVLEILEQYENERSKVAVATAAVGELGELKPKNWFPTFSTPNATTAIKAMLAHTIKMLRPRRYGGHPERRYRESRGRLKGTILGGYLMPPTVA